MAMTAALWNQSMVQQGRAQEVVTNSGDIVTQQAESTGGAPEGTVAPAAIGAAPKTTDVLGGALLHDPDGTAADAAAAA